MEWVGWVIAAAGVTVTAVSGIIGIVWRLSAKVYTIEIWARDEFVRKASFEQVVARLEKGIGDLGEKIEGRFDKLAERIEKITHN